MCGFRYCSRMDSRDKTIDELRALIAKQSAQLEKQAAQLKKQAARISELELALAKAKKDSTTSSKPPSSDLTKPKPKAKKGSRRMPRKGGQPGHQRRLREPLPPDRVDETIEYEIDDHQVRRLGLTPTGQFESIQHIELPDTPVHVTEHRLAIYEDRQGQQYLPDCPELGGPIFGPRLLATIGWLKSVGHCSYSTVEAWMQDVLQVPVSRGYLAKLCTNTISASLSDAYDELTQAIPHQQQLGSDETSIKDNGRKHWLSSTRRGDAESADEACVLFGHQEPTSVNDPTAASNTFKANGKTIRCKQRPKLGKWSGAMVEAAKGGSHNNVNRDLQIGEIATVVAKHGPVTLDFK